MSDELANGRRPDAKAEQAGLHDATTQGTDLGRAAGMGKDPDGGQASVKRADITEVDPPDSIPLAKPDGRVDTESMLPEPPPLVKSAGGPPPLGPSHRSRAQHSLPTRFGPWIVDGEIGKGGMGVVLRGRHESTNEVVAIKTVRPDMLCTNPALGARFVKEAKHTASLRHENILALRDVVEGPQPYYIMPFVQGGSLRDRTKADRMIAPERLLPIMLQVVSALEHAHRAGKVHRDVKPANILIDERGRAYVSDFGLVTSMLADVADDGDPDDRRSFGSGTQPYMAPELFLGEAGDYRVDVYAVGATMYELLCGSAPYAGTQGSIQGQIQSGPPTRVRELNPRIPRGWETVIEGAMARDLHTRYATMRDLRADLERLRDGDSPLGPSRNRPKGSGRIVGGILVTMSMLVVLGGALAAYLLIDWSNLGLGVRSDKPTEGGQLVGTGGTGGTGGTSGTGGTGGTGGTSGTSGTGGTGGTSGTGGTAGGGGGTPESDEPEPSPSGPETPIPTLPSLYAVKPLIDALAACTQPNSACVEEVRRLASALQGPLTDADQRELQDAIKRLVAADRADLVLALRAATAMNLLASDSDSDGTLLHLAVENRAAKVVAALLQPLEGVSNALDPDARNGGGQTAIDLAAQAGYVDTVEALIKGGADVTIAEGRRGGGDTALHLVCSKDGGLDADDYDIVRLLVESRSPNDRSNFVNARGRDSDTPLHRLVRRADVDEVMVQTFRFLLNNGGDPGRRNDDGQTVSEVIDEHVLDKDRRTALLKACESVRRP